MPDVDELKVVRRVCAPENTGFVYIILLTARSSISDVAWGMDHGANVYLVKPAGTASGSRLTSLAAAGSALHSPRSVTLILWYSRQPMT